MAKETYRIIFVEDCGTNKAGTSKTGLNFEQQLDFMMDNFTYKGKFKIEPEQKITTSQAKDIVKKSDVELFEEEKEKFYDSLTATEISSIRDNKKTIRHNQQVGFYLGLKSSKPDLNEINVSVEGIRAKEKRKIYAGMKELLKCRTTQISSMFYYNNEMFNQEDLEEMIDELFKGKC